MRVLHVNKFLYRRGGAEGYMLGLSELQVRAGDEVEFFGMSHPENPPYRHADLFPSRVEFGAWPAPTSGRLRAATRVLYSPAARRGMHLMLDRFQPDVVHLHNIYHHLSPSILSPLRDRGTPAVMTLHDYKLACPTYQFLAGGAICEACLGGHFSQAIRKRCNSGSIAKSALNAVEMSWHLASGLYDPIRVFVCPSRFMASKMAEAGVFPDRMHWIPHFVNVQGIAQKQTSGGSVLYMGRLSHEKGVDVLIRAAALLGIPIEIAGDGPERSALEQLAAKLGVAADFLGRLSGLDLRDRVREALVTVVPSRWYENQPLAVLESLACGVPVIATRLGGLPELIDDGTEGRLIAPNDPQALAEALTPILANADDAFKMGRVGRRKVETMFSPELHLERLSNAYRIAGAS